MVKMTGQMLGEKQRVSRKQAAVQQIEMAIRLLQSSDFACSITLALAAEAQMPITAQPHVYERVRATAPKDVADKFNAIRDWLKHCNADMPEELDIFEFEVAVALIRATTKFYAVYQETTPQFETFVTWAKVRGFGGKSTLGERRV
jgi:hypothetical protein